MEISTVNTWTGKGLFSLLTGNCTEWEAQAADKKRKTEKDDSVKVTWPAAWAPSPRDKTPSRLQGVQDSGVPSIADGRAVSSSRPTGTRGVSCKIPSLAKMMLLELHAVRETLVFYRSQTTGVEGIPTRELEASLPSLSCLFGLTVTSQALAMVMVVLEG